MASTITIPYNTLLRFNEVKAQEALRVKKQLTHNEFIILMTEIYKRVGGDTFVLDAAWEKVKERGKL